MRTQNAPEVTSQTAINAPLSATTSRQQSSRFHPGASGSNISTPRTSSAGRWQQQQDISLTEHYNVPLVAPKPWSSTDRLWTKSQLNRERQEFFETRVTGQAEIWAALKEVTQLIRKGDLSEAQGILEAAGITLPTGKLEIGAYDERGMLYKLPENIITDPVNLTDDDGETVVGELSLSKKLESDSMVSDGKSLDGTDEKPDKGKEAIEKDAIKVKCRLSDRGGPDTMVLIGKSQPVSVLLRRIRSEATISSSATVRIVYFGKLLSETKTLEEQGWQQGHVIQALVSNFGAAP